MPERTGNFSREVKTLAWPKPENLEGVVRTRRGIVEAHHRVHVAVVDPEGTLLAWTGDTDWPVVYRSAAKPFQALPLVEEGVVDEFGFTGEELALAAASHNGEPEHLVVAERILDRVGFGIEDLGLGPLPPLRPRTAESLYRSGGVVSPLHNNCSGQHAAMLGLARLKEWDVASYLEPDHPLQARMLAEMARFTGLEEGEIATSPDGCGMLAFAVPLRRMALSFAGLGALATSEEGPARVLSAMAEHPFMVAGTGRICTALLEATKGRMVGKLGADGVYGIALPEEGMGLALKVQDGSMKAGDVAVVRVLDRLGLLDPEEAAALEPFRRVEMTNTRGEVVGTMEATFQLR